MTLLRKVINHIFGCVGDENIDTDLSHPAFNLNKQEVRCLEKKLYTSMSKTRQDSQMLLELNIPCFIELKTMKVVCSLAEIKIL